MTANVPYTFSELRNDRVRISRIPSGGDWGGMASDLNYLNGRGIQLIPHATITGTLKTTGIHRYAYCLPVNKQATTRVWNISFSSSYGVVLSSSISGTAFNNVADVRGFSDFRHVQDIPDPYAQNKHERSFISVKAQSAITPHAIMQVSTFESPRVQLDSGNADDYAVEPSSVEYRSPIYDAGQDQNYSVGGVMRSLSASLHIPRRVQFAWMAPFVRDGSTLDSLFTRNGNAASGSVSFQTNGIKVNPRKLNRQNTTGSLTVALYMWTTENGAAFNASFDSSIDSGFASYDGPIADTWISGTVQCLTDDEIDITFSIDTGHFRVASVFIFEDS